jgi:acyl-CoA reductase-like NAD-dependent aldehyde dehydrogenase
LNLSLAESDTGPSFLSQTRAQTQAAAAANHAAQAFWEWSKTSAEDRIAKLDAMADALDSARDLLVETAATEVGASPQWTDFNISIAKQTLRQAYDLIPLMADQTVQHADGRTSLIRRQSVGVVLGFAPWNAPIILAVRAIAAPIACGNTVVLKASEHCPRTHLLLVDLFRRAGLPEHVVNVVTNDREDSMDIAQTLIRHPAVRRINFTGSSRFGQIVAVEAAKVLKPCLLELSGKAPLIVLEDADLDAAGAAAMTGAFFNQGQVCMSTERIIVLDKIADEFVARLVEKTAKLRAADPSVTVESLGRLINVDAATRVTGLIEDAVAKGATLALGGDSTGAVMQPAILDNVTPQMRIYREESFGPVASIIRVRNDEEAISVANDTEFGLASAVFSQDTDRCAAIADRLETGICQINGPTVFDDPTMPFGGMKSSGYGRFGGTAALDEFTDTRWLSQHHDLSAKNIEAMLNLGRKKA